MRRAGDCSHESRFKNGPWPREYSGAIVFRLHVLEIFVPALAKTSGGHYRIGASLPGEIQFGTGRKIRGFAPEAMEQMLRYRWPGNVRELKNVVERAVVLARGEFIEVEDLTLSKLSTAGDTAEVVPNSAGVFETMSLEELERRHIMATLNATSWNKSQTARILGIERSDVGPQNRSLRIGREFAATGESGAANVM